jgi:hypothetical protein
VGIKVEQVAPNIEIVVSTTKVVSDNLGETELDDF